MSSTKHRDIVDDLMMFTMDPLNGEENNDQKSKFDLSTSDYHSFDTSLLMEKKKMFDVTDLLGSSMLDDHQIWFDRLQPKSTSSPSFQLLDQSWKMPQESLWKIDQSTTDKDSRKSSRNLFENFSTTTCSSGSNQIRSQLVYTLTDSLNIFDVLQGTVISSC